MPKKNYIKKVEIIDERSSPEARGRRLRRIRNLANLSRREICDTEALNINTYKGWELGRYGGLPRDGAERVIQRISGEGVHCDIHWLLHERGPCPQVMPGYIPMEEGNLPKDDRLYRAEELLLFKQHYPQTIDFEVNDDSMLPLFRSGDLVAGIKHVGDNFDTLVGHNCIVQLAGGKTLLRRLESSRDQMGGYNLVSINIETATPERIIYNPTILTIAKVVWHRGEVHL